MKNIFQIGGVASGESFIGRRSMIEKYRNDYIDGNYRVGRSIVGLTRIGKTSFADVVFSNVPENVLVIKHDLKLSDNYQNLWKHICLKISKYLKKRKIHEDYLNQLLENIKSVPNMEWVEFQENIIDIFDELRGLEIRTIIVLDEFDYAENLFESKTHYFELFRTLFSEKKVSSMLLSRRQIYAIEGTTYQSSTFHGVLEPVYFHGFNNSDMQIFFDVFENGGISLTAVQKEEIEYYCGRAPFLLSVIGYYVVEAANNGEKIDISKIFKNKCKAINDYYRDCIQHLTRDGDLKRIIPFIIGPNTGVTQNDKDELINLGYLREQNGDLVAISRYFVNFLSADMLKVSIWQNIINLEKKIKVLLESELVAIVNHFHVGGDTMNEIQRSILERIDGVSGNLSMYDNFISNNLRVFDKESTYLDVMSLKDSFEIIKECWADIFSKYFDGNLFSEWEYKFKKCAKARNPIAHGHEEYLTDLDKNEVDTYCKQIFDILSKSRFSSTVPDEKKVIEFASKYACISKIIHEKKYKKPIDSLIGKEVDLLILSRGGRNKLNLIGIIDDQYKGIIIQSDLQKKTPQELDKMIGTTVKVTIGKIHGGHYVLNYNPS